MIRQSQNSMRKSQIFDVVGTLEHPIDQVDHTLATGLIDLTLDFSGCTFLSVGGIEWLEEILLRADSLKSKVYFVNLNPSIYKVLKVAHIDSLLKACGAPAPNGPTC